jgi:hypothetical protein
VQSNGTTTQWIGAIAEESGSEGDVISARVVIFPYRSSLS